MLIRHGQEFADDEKARTYIEANPFGWELYKRWGWKHVDEINLDMKEFGGTGIASEMLMIREPHIRF